SRPAACYAARRAARQPRTTGTRPSRPASARSATSSSAAWGATASGAGDRVRSLVPTPPRLARLHWSLGVLLGLVYLGVGALLLAAPEVGVPTLLFALGAYWLGSGGISALAALTRPRQAARGRQLLLALGQLAIGAYVWLELYVGIPVVG